MKTTIDIPKEELEETIRLTGARTKREAVVTAIIEFNRRRKRERLTEQLGTFDDVIEPAELLRQRESG